MTGLKTLVAAALISTISARSALAQAAPDPISKRLRSSHQGWTRDKSGSVEIGRSPLDSRAAAAIAGSGVRIGGIAW